MTWLFRMYVLLLGLGFLGAGLTALRGVTWTWTGMLLVLPVALLLLWLGGHALVAGVVACLGGAEAPTDRDEPEGGRDAGNTPTSTD